VRTASRCSASAWACRAWSSSTRATRPASPALEPGSIVAEVYGAVTASERHRHRYEVNNAYREQIADAGMVFSGISPDRTLVEFVELPREVHPFYVGTQAHPELLSRPNRAHPLFRGLVTAALERQRAARLFEVAEPGE
jgi:CTP synthase